MATPALVFQNLRLRLMRNGLALLLAQSWWRAATIVYVCAFIWILLFALSWYGFYELRTRPEWKIPLEQSLIELLFDLFFLTLTIFLVFSTSIILYSSLFSS